MNDFVFLFRSSDAEARQAMGTPEAAQRSMQTWLEWIHSLEANGHLKERGQPLERSGKVVRGKSVTDGPFVEVKDMVLGFIVVSARDIAHAVELAARCPIAIGGGAVEVRPVMTSPF